MSASGIWSRSPTKLRGASGRPSWPSSPVAVGGPLCEVAELAAMALAAPGAVVSLTATAGDHAHGEVGGSGRPDTPSDGVARLCDRVVATGEAMCVSHTDLGGPGAFAGAPIVLGDGRVAGALAVVAAPSRTWTPLDVRILSGLAARAATEVRLALAEAATGMADPLTGLAGRSVFLDRLDDAVTAARRAARSSTSTSTTSSWSTTASATRRATRSWSRSRTPARRPATQRPRRPDGRRRVHRPVPRRARRGVRPADRRARPRRAVRPVRDRRPRAACQRQRRLPARRARRPRRLRAAARRRRRAVPREVRRQEPRRAVSPTRSATSSCAACASRRSCGPGSTAASCGCTTSRSSRSSTAR